MRFLASGLSARFTAAGFSALPGRNRDFFALQLGLDFFDLPDFVLFHLIAD